MVRLRSICAVVALALLPGAVFAAPTNADKARAAELKKKGDELVHAGQYREALPLYEESFSLVPDPALHYNRGSALEKVGDFPAALDALEKFADTAPPALKARVPNLEGRMKEIAQKIATVVIRCSVEGASVTIRGHAEGNTPLPNPVRTSAGDATIDVAAPGYAPFHKEVTLAGGETIAIEAELVKEQPAPPPRPPVEDTTPPPPPDTGAGGGGAWKTVGFLSGGVGLASLGVGIAFFGLGMGDKGTVDAHCPNKACDAVGRAALNEAQTFATVSTVFVVVGAVGLAGGLGSLLLSPKSASTQARLWIGPGGLGVGGTFR